MGLFSSVPVGLFFSVPQCLSAWRWDHACPFVFRRRLHSCQGAARSFDLEAAGHVVVSSINRPHPLYQKIECLLLEDLVKSCVRRERGKMEDICAKGYPPRKPRRTHAARSWRAAPAPGGAAAPLPCAPLWPQALTALQNVPMSRDATPLMPPRNGLVLSPTSIRSPPLRQEASVCFALLPLNTNSVLSL